MKGIIYIFGFATLSLFLFACDEQDTYAKRNKTSQPNIIVIFTDDQGFADLGVQNQLAGIKTPNIDSIAENGVRFTHGYVTAPQCIPSRAGLISGQYQQRFGLDDNRYSPMPLDVKTLGQRFQELGYVTGLVGKWHLEVNPDSLDWLALNYPDTQVINGRFKLSDIPLSHRKQYFPDSRGYSDVYSGVRHHYWATFDADGDSRQASYIKNSTFRVDAVSDAAVAFINKHRKSQFYLHVAHFAPHVPLEATKKYLDRFPEDMEMRRRYALAMMSAIDDGVGRILKALDDFELTRHTLVFFVSDNGAPLGMDLTDAPIEEKAELWNGSLNTPLVGEKGMLTDGGIRVPFLFQWPGRVPAGAVEDNPVISLDIGYTALKAAGVSDVSGLDGLDLIPAIISDNSSLDKRALYWRFWQQGAVRKGRWKYLYAGESREFLFDLESDEHERRNLISMYPEVAADLREEFLNWDATLQRPRSKMLLNEQETAFYDYYFD